MSVVSRVRFTDYEGSVARALDLTGAGARLPQRGLVIIKPSLTNRSGPPVTTSVEAAEAVYKYCKSRTKAEIVIGEGCGDGVTADTFKANGYRRLADKRGIRLIDFNEEKAVVLGRKDAFALKEFYIPEVVKDAFIISLSVLKNHSLTATTVAMKNMFGALLAHGGESACTSWLTQEVMYATQIGFDSTN